MGLFINTNTTALNALRNLSNVSASVSTSTERLSSGLRINHASDDPAGLIISENLRAQIDGLNQAVANSQEASNVIKTADGALSQVNSLLRNIRQLAVHAGNTGVNDAVAVQADQSQVASAISSIDRIATQTQFGTKHLLDGSSGTSSSVVANSLISGISIGGTFGGYSTVNSNVTISAITAATRATSLGSTTYASGLSSNIGAPSTVFINGQTVSATTSDTVQTLINKINNLSTTTGVTASFDNTSNHINLSTQSYGSNALLNVSESGGAIGIGAVTAGTNASASVSTQVLVNNVTQTVTVTFLGGRSATDDGLQLTDTAGNSLRLTELGNVNGAAATLAGVVTAGSVQFQIGANAGQTVQVSLGNIRASNLGADILANQSLATVDVSTTVGANNAINIADRAITQISQLRASLGAFQNNTLNSTISYLGVGSENLSASESQIRDTNVAAEVVTLTKNQIIQQAATSVLAQANSQPQQILKLLQ